MPLYVLQEVREIKVHRVHRDHRVQLVAVALELILMIEISVITEQKRDTMVSIKKPAYSMTTNGFALELKPMVFGENG